MQHSDDDEVIEIVLSPEEVAQLEAALTATGFKDIAKALGLDPKKSFKGERLTNTDFRDSDDFLHGADFRGANLQNTIWGGDTSVKGARFEGADLTGATGLTMEVLSWGYIDTNTKLPEGMDRASLVALHETHQLPSLPADESVAKSKQFLPLSKPRALKA